MACCFQQVLELVVNALASTLLPLHVFVVMFESFHMYVYR